MSYRQKYYSQSSLERRIKPYIYYAFITPFPHGAQCLCTLFFHPLNLPFQVRLKYSACSPTPRYPMTFRSTPFHTRIYSAKPSRLSKWLSHRWTTNHSLFLQSLVCYPTTLALCLCSLVSIWGGVAKQTIVKQGWWVQTRYQTIVKTCHSAQLNLLSWFAAGFRHSYKPHFG